MTREELQSAIQDFWDETFNHSVHPEISAESKMIAFQCMIDEAKRRSTQPLTLEELRRMDGEPIWGESLISGKPGEWSILRVVEMSKIWFIACAGATQGFGDKDSYGKTWLAYRSKPKEGNR